MGTERRPGDDIRIVIIDDHAVLRAALAGMLDATGGLQVIASFGSVTDAVAAGTPTPDVVLLDVSMPEIGGLAGLPMVRERFPRAGVLVLSMHPVEVFGVQVMRAGAKGYLTKEAEPAELVAAIRRVADGRAAISEELAELLADASHPDRGQAPHESLTSREMEVMQRLVAGARVTDIANELHLSVKTVSTYRGRIIEKMGLNSTADLVRYALEHQLLSR